MKHFAGLTALGYLFESRTLATGWVSGVALAGILSDHTVLHMLLFTATMILSTVEMFTCYGSTPPEERRDFHWEKRIQAKLMIYSLWVVALIMDLVILRVTGMMALTSWANEIAVNLPFAASTLVWIGVAEAKRSVQHVKHSAGQEYVPPSLLWLFRQMKRIDQERFPGAKLPERRWRDRLSASELAELLAEAEERERLERGEVG